MRFLKLLTFVLLAVFAGTAQAQHLTAPQLSKNFGESPEGQQKVFQVAQQRSEAAYIYIKRITYIYSGVGVIGLVIMAVFGRFQWKWLFALVGGLFVLAGAQQLVFFLN